MLTYEGLIELKRKFDNFIVSLKTLEKKMGWCVCDNCFGDRQMLIYLYKYKKQYSTVIPRRFCLINTQQLTDLGNLE